MRTENTLNAHFKLLAGKINTIREHVEYRYNTGLMHYYFDNYHNEYAANINIIIIILMLGFPVPKACHSHDISLFF